MTLPATGPLKMSAINAELKFVPIARTNLGGIAIRNLAGKLTGKVSYSDIRGKSSRILTTKIYYSSTTWKAPASTTSIITLSGLGGVGSQGYSYVTGYTMVKTVKTSAFIPPYPSIYTEVINTTVTTYPTTYDAPIPSGSGYSYYLGPSTGTIAETQPGYRYDTTTYSKRTDYETVPDVFGGSATAFGKTFVGTYGSAPVKGTYYDLPVVPNQTYTITVPSGGMVTFTYEEDTPSYTVVTGNLVGTGTLIIPANTSVTLVGNGAPGTATYNAGQPYIAPTVTTNQNQHGRNEAQGLNPPYPCSDTPGSTGPTNVTFATYGTTKYVYWDCPTTTSTGGQPYIPAGYTYSTGASATVTLNNVTKTFVGGTGDIAAPVTSTVSTGSTAQPMTYDIPTGGSMNFSYLVPL